MKSWSLNAKFGAVLSIFIVAAIGIISVALVRIHSVNQSLNYLVGTVAQRVILSQSLLERTSAIRNLEKELILEDTQEGKKKVGLDLDEIEQNLHAKMEDYRRLADATESRSVETLESELENWKKISARLRSLSLQGREAEAEELARGESNATMERFAEEIEVIETRNADALARETKITDEIVESARNIILATGVVSLVSGLMLAALVLRALSRSIEKIIADLDDNSAQVTSAAQQIASSSHELSHAATEQASALEETASSIEELNSMVQKNTDNAKQASDVSLTGNRNAEHGKRVVDNMITAIQAINESNATIMRQIEHSNQEISEIVQVINEIGSKTKVINDIVFQTKLLSFNASVEAARAGEHGKGFAVVAEEVGTLAQMSGNAAKEISSLLENSIQKVERIVEETKTNVSGLIEEGRIRVSDGMAVADQCREVLEKIVDNVGVLNRMSSEIAQASGEQAQGVHEITKAMAQLDQVTHVNAATSEQSASASEELSAQAQALRRVVRTLVGTIRGERVGYDDSRFQDI